jgi:hypothetical protein
MAEKNSSAASAVVPLLTVDVVEAQGKNERDLLTHRVKLLLDAKDKHPTVSFQDLSHLVYDPSVAAAGCGSCCCPGGCGSCCCCNTPQIINQGDPAPYK